MIIIVLKTLKNHKKTNIAIFPFTRLNKSIIIVCECDKTQSVCYVLKAVSAYILQATLQTKPIMPTKPFFSICPRYKKSTMLISYIYITDNFQASDRNT